MARLPSPTPLVAPHATPALGCATCAAARHHSAYPRHLRHRTTVPCSPHATRAAACHHCARSRHLCCRTSAPRSPHAGPAPPYAVQAELGLGIRDFGRGQSDAELLRPRPHRHLSPPWPLQPPYPDIFLFPSKQQHDGGLRLRQQAIDLLIVQCGHVCRAMGLHGL